MNHPLDDVLSKLLKNQFANSGKEYLGFSDKSKVSAFNKSQCQTESAFNPTLLIRTKPNARQQQSRNRTPETYSSTSDLLKYLPLASMTCKERFKSAWIFIFASDL
jgi:hypothetical protein